MGSKPRRIPSGAFKARCLALLDEVAATGASIVVTKHGKPVAKLVPFRVGGALPDLRGSVVREADIVSPIDVRWKPGGVARVRASTRTRSRARRPGA